LRERAGIRAWEFEKRLEEGKGSEWTRQCWQEMKERAKNGRTKLGGGKKRVFRGKGVGYQKDGEKSGGEGRKI